MRTLTILLALAITPCSFAQKPGNINDAADLEAFFDGAMRVPMETKHIAGGVVTVVSSGKVVFSKGYGYADVAKRVPVDPATTMFRIASISKPFTWTAVMQQVEAGKLDLDTDINQYLKEVQIPASGFDQPITLKHLLTHTPGFEDHVIGLFKQEPDTRSLREVLQARLPARVRPPGKLASYSNHGTALAMYVVECVSGQPWESYIEQKVFQPLGMKHALVRQPTKEQLPATLSKGYVWSGGQFVEKGFEYVPAGPAGCLSVSGEDMAKFMLAHLGDGHLGEARILKAETAKKMREPLFQHDKRLCAMCYGFFEERHNGLRLIGHGGDTIFFHSMMQLIPEKGTGFFISFNTESSGGVREQIQSAFLQRYYPVPVPARSTADAAFKSRAAQIAGEYRNTRYSHTTLAKLGGLMNISTVAVNDDDTITLARGDQVRRLVEVKPFEFREVDGTMEVLFQPDPDGRGTYLFANNGPHSSNIKLPWYDTRMMYLGVMIGSLFLFVTALVIWPAVGWMLRGTTHATVRRTGFSAFLSWLGWLLSLVALGFTGTMAALAMNPNELVFGLSDLATKVLLVPQVIAGLTALTLIGALIAWVAGYWKFTGRLHYTLVALAGVGLVWFLWSWQLLTWGMVVQQ